MEPVARCLCLVLLVASAAPAWGLGFDSLVGDKDTNTVFSPCGDTTVKRADGFTFGLALASNSSFYLKGVQHSPCDKRINISSGYLSTFRPKVDEISILVINESHFSLDTLGTHMVAFAGSKFAAISPPHLVKDQQHIITSYTLVLQFVAGRMETALWKSDGCSSCQGKTSFVCLKNQDCAIQQKDCKRNGGKEDCSLTLQLAFSGTDNRNQVLNSWYEVSNLQQYSLYGLYGNLKNSLSSQYNQIFNIF